jgi:surface carbohydrate biosynthesis protein (TIGR04326 family)
MICWQQLCQRRWLDEARPRVVVWPWENHAWERAFVGAARAGGVRTLGYQHATVGAREWNHSPASDPADEGSLPDRILCTGEAGRAALLAFGVPAGRLAIGGALRLKTFGPLRRDPAGPVFVALPFDAAIAAQMVDACRRLADKGWRFVVKDHPMTPFAFAGGENMVRADRSLADQPAVSAVLYAATTVGLEAILGGLPTLRFVPEGKVPNDPVPAALAVPAVSAATLQAALHDLRVPPPPAGAAVFAPPDLDLWRSELA